MGWRDKDIEVATPALPQNEKGNGQAVPPNAVSFESAGFRARNLLIIDATHLGLRTPDHEASAGATLLSAKMREKIASLTGAVLPAHGGDTDADLWQIAQMLWRHGGEAIIVTKDQTGRLVDLLSKHLKPYVLSGREQNRSAKR
jgi:hypothetical protein